MLNFPHFSQIAFRGAAIMVALWTNASATERCGRREMLTLPAVGRGTTRDGAAAAVLGGLA